ncbi:E3 ubiquitin-protein ligase RNF4 isoform X2 [Copidosoma floridanum]|nr:E3 ubiquitin-protein ligase RNF4 isoform X2 [Copidosoma floridanum]
MPQRTTRNSRKTVTRTLEPTRIPEPLNLSIPEQFARIVSAPQSDVQRNLEPCDFIDLTEDSPNNLALRRKRSNPSNNEVIVEYSNSDEVAVLEDLNNSSRLQKPKRPAIVIDLDETVTLDDSAKTVGNQSQKEKSLSCPICLENFITNQDLKPMTTPCGHLFCFECLKKITKSTKKCSMCQRPLSFGACIRLHI